MSDSHALALLIAEHHRIDPPGGKCTCGHETPLGELVSRHIADAIHAAGWVSPEVQQEALDAMALQVTYTEDGTWKVLRRFREARATVQRVRELCERWEGWTDTALAAELQPPLKVHLAARDLRTALDGPGGEGEA